MAGKHLSRYVKHALRLEPGRRRNKHGDIWWFEEPGQIAICVDTGQMVISARIPIAQIRAFIERHDRSSNDT